MSANAFSQEDYENETAFRLQKNKPKQSQNKPNSNPVLSAACPALVVALSVVEGVVEWIEWANYKQPGNEPKKLKRKRGFQELFCVSGLPERLTF